MKAIKIGRYVIGGNQPCFIIAEAGDNHNGEIALARKLIDIAREAGVDAVKFQTFKTERVVTRDAHKARYQEETTGAQESQFDMIKKLELSDRDFTTLSRYAHQKRLLFLSTPFDTESADFLDGLNVPAFKIASGEITNFPLLRHIARKGKPIIMSTGMSTLDEIGEALEVLRKAGADEIALLHCITSYPAKIEDMNLRVIGALRKRFNLPVGLSDHSPGIIAPIAAMALGACIIEKHFTLDKNLPGPDHKASLEPDELKEMVAAIRDVEKALGDGVRRLTPEEREIRKVARRSLVARVDIPRGTLITKEMLDVKRPGSGIAPKHLANVVGKVAKANIKQDELISLDKLRQETEK